MQQGTFLISLSTHTAKVTASPDAFASPPTYQSKNHQSSFHSSSPQQAKQVLRHDQPMSRLSDLYFGGTFLPFNALPPPRATLAPSTTPIALPILSNF
jgi:hypothetical protein